MLGCGRAQRAPVPQAKGQVGVVRRRHTSGPQLGTRTPPPSPSRGSGPLMQAQVEGALRCPGRSAKQRS